MIILRRWIIATGASIALVLAPAGAARAASDWVPVPTPPFDRAAGVVCDAPVHGEAIVDEVVKKVVRTSPPRELYKGRLIVRVTNTDTGGHHDADASGSAYVTHADDGSQTWYAVGPVLAGFREGGGNLPRGLYVIDGVYRLKIAADGYKTLTFVHGSASNVCDRL
jgi:hypothetical protein